MFLKKVKIRNPCAGNIQIKKSQNNDITIDIHI